MACFSITTLGCKVNQYDGAALAGSLSRAGLTPAKAGVRPDLVVINTCCVTSTAMRKSRQAVRRLVRKSPDATVLVTGCYSDYDAEAIVTVLASLGVPRRRAHVAGHHSDLADVVRKLVSGLHSDAPAIEPPAGRSGASASTSIFAKRTAAVKRKAAGMSQIGNIRTFPNRQRAFVKVQDGCDAFCSYCVVPYTRPIVRSRTVEEITRECRALVKSGHKEIVISGVFLGAFGRQTTIRRRWTDRTSALPGLLEEIAGIDGLWRVRLSSLEPGDVTGELLDVFTANPKVAPHFHLPLQSGSAAILKRMRRQYTPEEYRHTVRRVRSSLDRPAITTDVIVGFPGESDTDFAETLEIARFAGFAKIHTFPFSAIEGTAAWRYRHEAPPPDVVKERIKRLGELEASLAANYRNCFIGETMEAIVESPRPAAGVRQAMTDRYITVQFTPPPRKKMTGKVVALDIQAARPDGLIGRIRNS